MEVMEESWRENPSIIITMIQANLKSERKKKETLSVDEIIKNLKSPKKNLTRFVPLEIYFFSFGLLPFQIIL